MMMQSEAREGVCYLNCKVDRWIWDQRTELLALNPDQEAQGGHILLHLKSFELMENDLRRLLKDGKLILLNKAFARLLRESSILAQDDTEATSLRDAFGNMAFFSLCFVLRQRTQRTLLRRIQWWKRSRLKEIADLGRTAERVLGWLGAQEASTAWRDRYSEILNHERRYKLVDMGRHVVEAQYNRETGISALNLSEREALVALWWSTRCQFDLAQEWYQREGHRPQARRALLEAAGLYLRLLKDEPRRHALEQFLDMTGTDPEREVRRIFKVRSKFQRKSLVAEDEAAHRVFIDWFLRRYSIWSAALLAFRAGMRREIGWAFLSLVLGAASMFFFVSEGPIPLKILLQVSSLIIMVTLAPAFFRLMLPRALFGSLIAWLTIVISQAIDAFPPEAAQKVAVVGPPVVESEEIRQICHRWLGESFSSWGGWIGEFRQLPSLFLSSSTAGPRIIFFGLLAAVLAVSFAFVANEVGRRVLRRGIWLRSVFSLSVMVVGSLFWGITFTPPIQFLIEGGSRPKDCPCIWGIWLLGSSISVLFGILVQVLSEERPLAAPLEEGS